MNLENHEKIFFPLQLLLILPLLDNTCEYNAQKFQLIVNLAKGEKE